ncbi:MAG: FAD:protein FMN transferase [Bacteroidales bacterium]|nr:FAD:protein FMN transferase [Bacteroidales bacterium]
MPMSRRVSHLLLFFLSLTLCSGCKQQNYLQITGYAQGGIYSVTYLPTGNSNHGKLSKEIDGLLQDIDNSISGYNKNSLLSLLNNGENVALDSIFVSIFNISKELYEQSGGLFDPSAAPLFDYWGFGFEEREDDEISVSNILEYVGMDLFDIEPSGDGTMHLVRRDPRAKLNFNAIAQGFSADLVAKLLEKYAITNYIVSLGGGEIVCKGERNGGGPWRVMIEKPEDDLSGAQGTKQDILYLNNGGVATSGNNRKFYIVDGKKYSHTINPVLGAPVEHSLLSATVTASNATLADAYATWMMVVGEEAAAELASQLNVGTYLVYDNNGQMEVWHNDIELESNNF